MSQGILVIINPHAGSGRAGRLWNQLEPLMVEQFGDLVVAITEHPQEVVEHLDKAYAAGLRRVIAVGGDGTNYIVANALLDLQKRQPVSDAANMVFGFIPMGTGQDFARSLHIPTRPQQAVRWLAQAKPHPLDIGCVEYDGQTRHFLNIASVGMSGAIDQRMEKMPTRRFWTFWLETVRAFLVYDPPFMTVRLDGELWYEGKSWIVAVANGFSFARGMKMAPQAQIDDGLLDVIVVEGMPRLTALKAFNTVYWGRHLLRKDVHFKRAQVVEIEAQGQVLPVDLDGEFAMARQLRFSVKPRALQVLS